MTENKKSFLFVGFAFCGLLFELKSIKINEPVTIDFKLNIVHNTRKAIIRISRILLFPSCIQLMDIYLTLTVLGTRLGK